jgi:site-specific DNA-methyltransferase (adenine-specific)
LHVEGELKTHWLVERYFLPSSGYGASALAKSLERQGAIEPVTLYEGRLLDGRIREQARRELGKPREAINFEDTPQGIIAAQARTKEAMDRAALQYAIAKNVARRHYTKGQLGASAYRLADMPQGARNDLPSAVLRKVSQEEAAQLYGVSIRSVQDAGRIFREGTPDEERDMLNGAPLEPIVDAIASRKKTREKIARLRVAGEIEPRKDATLICGDALNVLRKLPGHSIDACICDPPYGINIDVWDEGIVALAVWQEVLRVLKPGGWCPVFTAPRLYHRVATSIEEAGFQIRDMGEWINTGKMARKNGLKPAHEPVCIAQKPYERSLTYNQQKWGVGQINVEDARIPWDKEPPRPPGKGKTSGWRETRAPQEPNPNGRYPFNVVGYLDEEHLKYFFAPRVSVAEKGYFNDHPTTKPIALMQWLIRIFAPRGGVVLDPYMGSGSTGLAAVRLGRSFIGVEIDQPYVNIARRRFEEEIAVGRWSGQLSAQTVLDTQRSAGFVGEAVK